MNLVENENEKLIIIYDFFELSLFHSNNEKKNG